MQRPAPVPTVDVSTLSDPLPSELSVLDVREQPEWDHGHIEGATHIPLMQLPQRLGDVPDGKVLVVCKMGGRSARAVEFLLGQGRDAVNLGGGMIDWADAGRAMVSEDGSTPQVV